MVGKYTVANALMRYIEGLQIGQGRYAGEYFDLHPWEKRFIRGAFSVDGDAGLSIGRGNGKTTLVSAIAAATLDGPLIEPMAETVLVASSFDQGIIAFRHVLHFLKPALEAEPDKWRLQDNTNRASIENRHTGSRLKVIGSDPRRAHGMAPKLLLLDEVAQWPHTTIDRMLAALETSKGKIPDSRSLWLGTRASEPEHPFEQALKTLEYSQVHSAPKDAPPFQRRTWQKANPSLDLLPDLEKVIRREAGRAKRDPSALAHFRALRLNQGVSDTVENVLLGADVWREIETDTPQMGKSYVLGIDLGQNAAMSAASAYWTDTGGLDAFAVFPLEPNLHDRGMTDGVDRLYIECAQRGELMQAGLKVSDIGELLEETLRRWGAPDAIVCDRWREAELRQELVKLQYPGCPLVIRGMGFQDGGQDVREFRAACLDGYVEPVRSLLMRSAMSGARVTTDPAGNSKLAKGGQGRRMRCRDDAVAASILAVAEGRRRAKADARRQPFSYAVL